MVDKEINERLAASGPNNAGAGQGEANDRGEANGQKNFLDSWMEKKAATVASGEGMSMEELNQALGLSEEEEQEEVRVKLR